MVSCKELIQKATEDALKNTFYKECEKRIWCYFVTDGQFVKIGVSEGINRRMVEIQTGNPREISLIGLFELKTFHQALAAEHDLHKHFDKYHLRGEWFDILGNQDFTEFCESDGFEQEK